MLRPHLRRLPIALLLALSLIAASCGDDDDTTADGSDLASSSESASASSSESASASDSSSASEMADDEMAEDETDDEMADEEAADDEMAEDEAADDEMAEDEAAEGAMPADVFAAATAGGSTQISQYASFAPSFDAAVNGDGPVTAFLPSDEAFAAIPAEVIGVLTADFEALEAVLAYHAVDGALTAEDIIAAGEITTVQGEAITVTVDGDAVVLNDGQATVSAADLEAANGIAHVIEGLLVPPSLVETLAGGAGGGDQAAATGNVVEAAAAAGSNQIATYVGFSEPFRTAVEGPGPVTAFMPTDSSLLALPSEALTALRDFALLDDVLLYHAVDGAVTAEEIIAAGEITTLQGEVITVAVDGDTVVLNDGQATVAVADIAATNGLTHVIDGLLVPPSRIADVFG